MLFKKLLLILTCTCVTLGWSATPSQLEEIDSVITEALATFEVPGAAVALVEDGKVVMMKGYGLRDQKNNLPVTENTLFPIGSCTKAFTALLIGKLVDEGKLDWDDPIIQHIPEFRLKDPHATHKVTIRDALAHRSGLPRHDMVWYNSSASRHELMERLAHLELTAEPHEKFQYNNLMYATLGILLERVTGKTWETLVQEEIFTPLGMTNSQTDHAETQDFSLPYARENEEVKEIPFRGIANVGPAGSIESSVSDMARWIEYQLNLPTSLREMHTLQIGFPLYPTDNIHGFGYGLGWFVGSYHGNYWVEHGGGIDGFCSLVSLLPEKKTGLVLLTNNTPNGYHFNDSVRRTVQDILLDAERKDWVTTTHEAINKHMDEKPEAAIEVTALHTHDQYVGSYEHPGYGTVVIKEQNGILLLTFNEMSTKLKPKKGDLFVAGEKGDPIFQGCPFTYAFLPNAEGEIESLSVPFDLTTEPIVFKKVAEGFSKQDLLRFAGKYRGGDFEVAVKLRGSELTLVIPNQPVYTLVPEQGDKFSIKGLNAFYVAFGEKEGEAGLTLVQPNGDFFLSIVAE